MGIRVETAYPTPKAQSRKQKAESRKQKAQSTKHEARSTKHNNPINRSNIHSAPLIWRLTDGKAGHDNQSVALVENLQSLAPFESLDVPVSGDRASNPLPAAGSAPALVVGAGHRTHPRLLLASRRFDCPAVVIMKPSIPRAFFDLCLIPEHDLRGPPGDNVIVTRGMLNRIPLQLPGKEARGLLLIGGPSKHHGWTFEPLIQSISRIVSTRSDLAWHLSDSRRTPAEFLDQLPPLELSIHPRTDTPPDWLPSQLLTAREVWVTEDSMSMIYEALTAQCRLGLLPMPRKSPRSRIVRGIDRLVAQGWTRILSDDPTLPLPEPPERLHEASRCAREVLNRFFPSFA